MSKIEDIEVELTKLSPTKDNIIVIKVLSDIDHNDAIKMSEFINDMLSAVNPDAKAVMVSNKVEISEINEEVMNEFGWYRKRDTDDILELF